MHKTHGPRSKTHTHTHHLHADDMYMHRTCCKCIIEEYDLHVQNLKNRTYKYNSQTLYGHNRNV